MAIAAVRPATPDDVDEIVRIQADTWSMAYAGLVPAAALAQLREPAARAAWAAAVEAGDGHHVLVATEGAWTVGFCAAAPAVTPVGAVAPSSPTLGAEAWAEISALLVEPRWGRRGHGGRLLAAAADGPARRRCPVRPGLGARGRRRLPRLLRAAGWAPTAPCASWTPATASCARCA